MNTQSLKSRTRSILSTLLRTLRRAGRLIRSILTSLKDFVTTPGIDFYAASLTGLLLGRCVLYAFFAWAFFVSAAWVSLVVLFVFAAFDFYTHISVLRELVSWLRTQNAILAARLETLQTEEESMEAEEAKVHGLHLHTAPFSSPTPQGA